MGQQLRDVHAALSAPGELERRPYDGEVPLTLRDVAGDAAVAHGLRDLLPAAFVQERLLVEGLELGQTAGEEHEDDPLGLRLRTRGGRREELR